MNLSPDMQKVFVEEVRTAVKHMKNIGMPQEKLFFLSAVHGAASRIMNIQYDSELAFIHHVVNAAHAMMHASLISVKQGQGINTFPKDVFDNLEDSLEEMLIKVEKGERTHQVLEKILNLAYSTTGNGYYLYLKGILTM